MVQLGHLIVANVTPIVLFWINMDPLSLLSARSALLSAVFCVLCGTDTNSTALSALLSMLNQTDCSATSRNTHYTALITAHHVGEVTIAI